MLSLLYPLLLLLTFTLSSPLKRSNAVRMIYIYNDPLIADNTAIKTGFNTAIIFQVTVLPNADLLFYGKDGSQTILASNGVYTGGSDYSNVVQAYKTGDTTINRVEISLLSGTQTWQNIQNLINTDGSGSDTTLSKNFAALKSAWKLDAINDDDEAVYDLPSTVSFALMMGNLGYKFTGVPYENMGFWKSAYDQINAKSPGLFDRMYLQCYDGGDTNLVTQWELNLGFKVIPLLWVVNQGNAIQGEPPTIVQARMQFWKTVNQVPGGGLWNNADIEANAGTFPYSQYVQALEAVFGS